MKGIYAWKVITTFTLNITAVTKTETVSLLLGNNNCTCVSMESVGGLSFAISNPKPNEVDVICPIYVPDNQCYNPEVCNNFNGNIAPFFRICEDPLARIYILCFGNVTGELNRSRIDFFVPTRTFCPTSSVYRTRTYVRSFELSGEYI